MQLTHDEANVLLDSLTEMKVQIAAGRKPWFGYDEDPDDPKATEAGYRGVVAGLANKLEDILNHGEFPA